MDAEPSAGAGASKRSSADRGAGAPKRAEEELLDEDDEEEELLDEDDDEEEELLDKDDEELDAGLMRAGSELAGVGKANRADDRGGGGSCVRT